MRITASPFHLSSWNFTGTLPMRQEWALSTSGSKGQRSRSQCIDYWKWLMLHNCFPFTSIIMKLHTKTPLELRVCPVDVRVKGQGHNALIAENGFCCIVALSSHLKSWIFTHRLPMSWGCALLMSGSKGQGHNALIIENGFWRIIAFPVHLQSSNLTHRFPVSQGYALMILG